MGNHEDDRKNNGQTKTERQKMIYKTLHMKLKTEQTDLHKTWDGLLH